jgi:hypothetical protein
MNGTKAKLHLNMLWITPSNFTFIWYGMSISQDLEDKHSNKALKMLNSNQKSQLNGKWINNSYKNHGETRHIQDTACKIWDQLEKPRHVK